MVTGFSTNPRTPRALVADIRHGGDLSQAARLFPGAAAPWVDLSTGINPWPYPLPVIPPGMWTALPDRAALDAVLAAAAQAYGAPGPDALVAAPGTELLIQLLPRLWSLVRLTSARVAVVGPTYGDHARAWAAGHVVRTVADPTMAVDDPATDVMVLCNPNNPDGRCWDPPVLLGWADRLASRGGWLVVDEAYADLDPGASLAGAAGHPGLVALRSFGKFFGLAGLRLGFALAPAAILAGLRGILGGWAVSGPALAVAAVALADAEWQAATRRRLASAASALDQVLTEGGLRPCGGTALYRLVDCGDALPVWRRLAQAGLWTRCFPEHGPAAAGWLRVGLPPDVAACDRLRAALAGFRG